MQACADELVRMTAEAVTVKKYEKFKVCPLLLPQPKKKNASCVLILLSNLHLASSYYYISSVRIYFFFFNVFDLLLPQLG